MLLIANDAVNRLIKLRKFNPLNPQYDFNPPSVLTSYSYFRFTPWLPISATFKQSRNFLLKMKFDNWIMKLINLVLNF